jgi:hypothetical protein
MKRVLCLLTLLLLPLSASEFRPWRNNEGDKSIEGRFVKRDEFNLTILRRDHREITLPLSKIHADDVRWLNEKHPLPPPPPPKSVGVIDELRFGDSRSEVTAKLKKSPIFETSVPDTLFARTGLNGIFHTKNKIGGYQCLLSFNWHDEGGLKEIMLQTPTEDLSSWDSKLKPCFAELVKLISALHGKPLIANEKIDLTQLQDDSMTANYLWHLESKGSVLLGPAKENGKLMVAVRFSEETYQPQPE